MYVQWNLALPDHGALEAALIWILTISIAKGGVFMRDDSGTQRFDNL